MLIREMRHSIPVTCPPWSPSSLPCLLLVEFGPLGWERVAGRSPLPGLGWAAANPSVAPLCRAACGDPAALWGHTSDGISPRLWVKEPRGGGGV